MRLSQMVREGTWVKLGSPTGETGIREFLRKARPSYVFYMAGIGDQNIISGNEQAIVRQNVMAPLHALRYAEAMHASAFVYVTDTRDERGSGRMYTCGEEAVLARQSEEMSVAAVRILGLMEPGGYLSRLVSRAEAGQKLSCQEGEKKAFISCRSAAAALLGIAQSRGRGRLTVKGSLEVDLPLLLNAVTSLTGSRAVPEVQPAEALTAESELIESGLEYTFRRTDAPYPLPEQFTQTPPVLPDSQQCARILGDENHVQ